MRIQVGRVWGLAWSRCSVNSTGSFTCSTWKFTKSPHLPPYRAPSWSSCPVLVSWEETEGSELPVLPPGFPKQPAPSRAFILVVCLSPTPSPKNHELPPTGVQPPIVVSHHTSGDPSQAGKQAGRTESAHLSDKEAESEQGAGTWSRPPDG